MIDRRCRPERTSRISSEALVLLEEAYQLIAEKCTDEPQRSDVGLYLIPLMRHIGPECATPAKLLPDMLATAGLDESRGRPALHVFLLRAMLAAGVLERYYRRIFSPAK